MHGKCWGEQGTLSATEQSWIKITKVAWEHSEALSTPAHCSWMSLDHPCQGLELPDWSDWSDLTLLYHITISPRLSLCPLCFCKLFFKVKSIFIVALCFLTRQTVLLIFIRVCFSPKGSFGTLEFSISNARSPDAGHGTDEPHLTSHHLGKVSFPQHIKVRGKKQVYMYNICACIWTPELIAGLDRLLSTLSTEAESLTEVWAHQVYLL